MTNPRDVSDIVAELREALSAAEARNEMLSTQVFDAEYRLVDAQRRYEGAETKIAKVGEKLAKLQQLTDGEFQGLISELFAVPSKRAARLTVTVAAVSIVISILVSLVATLMGARLTARDNAGEMAAFRREMAAFRRESLSTMIQSDARPQNRLAPLAANHPKVLQAIGLITANRTEFRNYRNANDLQLLYKFRLVPGMAPTDHALYLFAFLGAGVPRGIIPTDPTVLAKWDVDMQSLYEHMILSIQKAGTPDAAPSSSVSAIGVHKSPNDETDYGTYSYSGTQTYAALLQVARTQKEAFDKQLEFNRK